MSERKATQSEKILAWMRSSGWISPLDALNYFGCFRLGARIYDLRQQGHGIEDEFWLTPGGARVKRYRLSSGGTDD